VGRASTGYLENEVGRIESRKWAQGNTYTREGGVLGRLMHSYIIVKGIMGKWERFRVKVDKY